MTLQVASEAPDLTNGHHHRHRQVQTLHFSASLAACPRRKMVRDGVLGLLETLMISLSRGTPRVTFLADTPA